MIGKHYSQNILTIGPDYKNHRGGIGAVISIYSNHFKPFNFISTYSSVNKRLLPFCSLIHVFYLFFYLLNSRSIKIIHIHGASRGSFFRKYLIFLIAKYIYSKKVIYHIHGGGFHIFYSKSNYIVKSLIKNFINQSDVVICLSDSWKKYYSNTFTPKRIEVIPNFIERYDNQNSLSPHPSKVIFLFLGKIMQAKGVFDLLEVAKDLAKHHSNDFELWIGGNGEVNSLKAIIENEKLQSAIKFIGWVSGYKKEEVLKTASVYVLPSYNEGMPVSILEAMAHGIPVISTNVGGIPELVRDNISGYLIKPGDKIALRNSMEAFLVDRNLIGEMGNKSKEIVERHYTSEVIMKKLDCIYSDLLDN